MHQASKCVVFVMQGEGTPFYRTLEAFVPCTSKLPKFHVNPENKTHKYEMDKNGKWFSPTNLRKTGVDNSAIKNTPIPYLPKASKPV